MTDFDTSKLKTFVKCKERFVFGHTDWRAVYGTKDTLWYRIKCWWRDSIIPFLRRLV